jgi:hypothetical protein
MHYYRLQGITPFYSFLGLMKLCDPDLLSHFSSAQKAMGTLESELLLRHLLLPISSYLPSKSLFSSEEIHNTKANSTVDLLLDYSLNYLTTSF